jgi:lipopolysaccharide/colanic/teichoic acid biosynthesis glycosyltransferase
MLNNGRRLYLISKRLFDFLFSLLCLIGVSPLMVVSGLLVKRGSPGPVFYRGIRTGVGGKPFRIFKFRTMIANAESIGGPSTGLNDLRVTAIGRFLRKYKLDELPQLINILLGDMSFVGPRPQVEKYTKLYQGEEMIILTVKPGLTDYASLKFINLDLILGDENVDEKYMREIEPQKNTLRIKYVKNQSFFEDMRILAMTLIQMLKIRSKWNIEH